MSRLVEMRMPKYPECWESCGSCRPDELFVDSVLIRAGEHVDRDATVIVLETGKVALDIPSPHEGRIVEVHVSEGDTIDEGGLIATVEVE